MRCLCLWFGEWVEMEIIGFDCATEQYRVKHLDSYGSFYTKEIKALHNPKEDAPNKFTN